MGRASEIRTFTMLGIGFALFVGVGWMTREVIHKTSEAIGWVDHTHAVIESLDGVIDGLGRSEAARRGFSLTGDEGEERRFGTAELQIGRDLKRVHMLTADNPPQQERIERLEHAAAEQLETQRLAIEERKRGFSLDREEDATRRGSTSALAARHVVHEMIDEERALLDARERERRALVQRSERVAVGGAALGIGLLGTSFVRLLRETRRRRRTEEAERAARLRAEQMNAELEAFSYAVAHDLRTPLRGIDGFSRIVVEDYGDKLDDVALSHLARVRKASQRMSELIEALLRLSQVSREELAVEDLDIAALARECADALQRLEPERKIELRIADSLPARGDRRLVKAMLENLIENAFKFTSKRAVATVEVGEESPSTYFVRDNGAGFDMQYASKLFGAFQRLHDEQHFPGTGIGLATAQRIVRRHGGVIWAESTLDRGATFRFTLRGAS